VAREHVLHGVQGRLSNARLEQREIEASIQQMRRRHAPGLADQ
jgi:hypothetical protein